MARLPITPNLTRAFTDHDRLFKELLTVFFVDFIELFLPALAAEIDRDSITFLDKELFTNVTTGEKHIADVVARVRFCDQEAFFILHVENQAASQADFARRMFEYFSELLRKYDLPVYPVALFTFDQPVRAERDRYQITFPSLNVLDFHFHAIQLNRLNWRDFLDRPNPVAAALMAKMKIATADRPRVKLECLRLLATLRLDPARTQLIAGFVDSYLRLTAQEIQIFDRDLAALPQEERDETMPLTISWKEEGRVEGRAEGRVEGRVESKREILLHLGAQRLGIPSTQVENALLAINSEERLLALIDNLSSVETWGDLLASPSA